ncbi:MAG: membrane protein insertase YidC, partial [Betaproteobacteria bacterium]|nr:membrane protein insertase YidC [Betaproteobacteria bacterium]
MNRNLLRWAATIPFLFLVMVMFQRWEEFKAERVEPQQLGTSPGEPAPVPQPSDAELPEVTRQFAQDDSSDLPALASETPAPAAAAVRVAAEISNDSLIAKFDGQGNLIELDLLAHASSFGGDPLPLLYTSGSRRYNIQTGMLGTGLPSHRDRGWQTEKRDERTVASIWQDDSLRIERVFTLAETGYLITVSMQIDNNSSEPVAAHAYFQLLRDTSAPGSYSALLPSFYGAVTYTGTDKYAKYDFDDLEDWPEEPADGWIGIVQRYFLVAWLDGGSDRQNFMRNIGSEEVAVGLIRSLGTVPPAQQRSLSQPLFAGALEQDMLDQIPEGQDLHLAVDYGWLTVICKPLFALLSLLHDLFGNWGVAIIVLTLLVKLVFYPLSSASFRSMARLKQFSPKIKQLKDRFGDDREGFQKAMMDLYRREKINPLSGCLPILIQIPVFIALYWVILGSVELRHEPF